MVSAAFGVADDDVLRAYIFQHVSGNFAGECTGQVHVYVLSAQSNAAAGQCVFRLVQVHHRRCDSDATTVNAAQLIAQSGDQFVNHVSAAVKLPVTHN
ncbi:hypothetical protein D3C76_1716820 [compost metagenome]